MKIETDYGSYDDNDVGSMLNYCCRIRGNPLDLIHRTLIEFGWFVDTALWGGYYASTAKPSEERDEAYRIYHSYRGRINNSESPVIQWARLFVEYCTEEYCND